MLNEDPLSYYTPLHTPVSYFRGFQTKLCRNFSTLQFLIHFGHLYLASLDSDSNYWQIIKQ